MTLWTDTAKRLLHRTFQTIEDRLGVKFPDNIREFATQGDNGGNWLLG